jgi:toluene monooxygenase system protein D
VITSESSNVGVGPVLQATPLARAIVEAIEDENERTVVHDEGAYLRVLVPRTCRLSRAVVEATTGYPVHFPGDLEVVMSSFTGLMQLNEYGAIWWVASEPAPPPPGPDAAGGG